MTLNEKRLALAQATGKVESADFDEVIAIADGARREISYFLDLVARRLRCTVIS